MDVTQLRYFQMAAQTGNFSQAARRLYITQPNLSRSIARLEEELGVPLFIHRKGKIQLNDYGRVFLSSVDIVLQQLDTGVRSTQRMYEADQHILSLACNISGYLPDVLPDFCAAHPEIGIRQLDCSARQMAEGLLDGTVSMGISCESVFHEPLEFHQLGQKEYVLILNEDHPLAQSGSVPLWALSGETFICDASRLGRDFLQKVCQNGGFSPNIGYEVESTALLFQLLEAGRGVSLLPLGLCCQMMQQHPGHHLRLASIASPIPPSVLGIVRNRLFPVSKAAALFEDYLRDYLLREEDLIRQLGYTCFLTERSFDDV